MFSGFTLITTMPHFTLMSNIFITLLPPLYFILIGTNRNINTIFYHSPVVTFDGERTKVYSIERSSEDTSNKEELTVIIPRTCLDGCPNLTENQQGTHFPGETPSIRDTQWRTERRIRRKKHFL